MVETYLLDLPKPHLHVTARLAQQEVAERRDLRADTRGSNWMDRDMDRASLLNERALLQLVARASGERGAQACEEAARLRCHDAGRHTRAIRQPAEYINCQLEKPCGGGGGGASNT